MNLDTVSVIYSTLTPSPLALRIAKALLGDNKFVDVPGVGRLGVENAAEIVEETLEKEADQ